MATTRRALSGLMALSCAVVLAVSGLTGCSGDSGGTKEPVSDLVEIDQAPADGTADLVGESCETDDECAPYRCDAELKRCVECITEDDCQEGYVCSEYRCTKTAGECSSDAQCDAFGKVCDTATNKCVECVKSKNCETGNYCKDQKCVPWECTAGARWCEGQVAKSCNNEGSALLATEECDDGNPCTEGDECLNGQCAEPQEKNCSDDNPCTDDSCHPQAGCVHQYNSDPCEDGTTCTTGDTCSGGECVSGPSSCQCVSNTDCDQYDDGDKCNGVLTCGNGTCIPKRNSAVVCPASSDPCQKLVCKPETGLCVEVVGADGDECDDLDSCTLDDKCQSGVCVGLTQTCDDNNYCTMDACNPSKGCVNTPVTGPCDDGDLCTSPDSCQNGVCVGTQLTCQDSEPCTQNWCEPGVGCKSTVLTGPCEDGSLCTEDDMCVNGKCTGSPVVCNDGNGCTNDSCEASKGCVFTNNTVACDDENPCTVNDHCQGGECVPGGTLFACNDNNPCTNDSCNIDTGECVYINNSQSCTDNDPCTQGDMCQGGMCVPGPEPDCDDGIFCTNDYCDSQGICRNLPITGACDDGNACTQNDTCIGGNCKGGSPVSCDDNNLCTDDWCEQVGGCKHAFNTNPCNDMNLCTINDMCSEGTCIGATAVSCDDGKPCTQDDCSPMTGCSHLYVSGACDDGDLCTSGDYCAAGACIKGQLINCDDGNDCTTDTCESSKGCVHSFNSNPCEDGNPCSKNDKCSGGACAAGEIMDCNDGNICTDDSCDFTTCLHVPNLKGCDDNEACTSNDHCANGYCVGTQLDNCGCHSLHLDGSAGYVEVANNALLNLGTAATVEMYIKPETQTGAKALLNRWGASDNQAFRIGVTQSSSTVTVELKVAGSGTAQTLTGTYSGTGWHHVAFVVDGAQARLYLDGTQKATAALAAGIATSAAPLRIGTRAASSGAYEQYYKGLIDEIRISNVALYSGASFTPLPRYTVVASTIAYYKADQQQFNTLFDSTTNYIHGRIYDTYYFTADAVATKCAPLDNYPPSSPRVEVQPIAAMTDKDLTCQMLAVSVDNEYDPITYKYEWYLNGVLQPQYTTETVPASALQPCPRWKCSGCQQWTCKVTPFDSKPGLAGENSQAVGITKCLDCDGSVYNDHCYKVVGSQTDWGSAKSGCNTWGGWLAAITDGAEQAACEGFVTENAWIGLSDTEVEGNYIWVTAEPFSYDHWGSGQPNDIGTQDCVMMYKDYDYKWNDMKCSNDNIISSENAKQYLCERAYPWP